MTAAVILLWAGCLWSIARTVLWLVWAAALWRRVLVLAVLALALSTCRSPKEMSRNHL